MLINLLRLGRVRRTEQVRLAQYNLADARMYLSRLVDRVLEGEEIVIARGGRPLAKLVAYEGFELTQPAVLRAKVLLEPGDIARAPQAPVNGGGAAPRITVR